MSLPSSESKNKPSNKPARKQVVSRACIFFDPEDGGDVFL
jgi:hypothetical protein